MEKRNNARVPFQVHSIIKYHDSIIEGEIDNLSTGGLLLKTADALALNEAVDISIFLYGASSHLALNMVGKTVRKTDLGMAIKFIDLDLDSFIHLRNIVTRNSLDDAILREYRNLRTDGAGDD